MLESFSNKQSVCIHNASKIVLYKIPDSWVGVVLSPAQTKKKGKIVHADMLWILFPNIIVTICDSAILLVGRLKVPLFIKIIVLEA
jgi:hypothetical protein